MGIFIGIDLGGMSAKAACLVGGKLTAKAHMATSAQAAASETADVLASLFHKAAELAGVREEEVTAVGIGAPGVIDGRTGTVVRWSNFGWNNVPLASLVHERIEKPVFLVNDANAAALGEAKYGAGQGYDDCALLTLGTGVGSGFVLGGKLFEGFCGAGTEFGHVVIRQDGELCTCGRKGCFERYASATALIRMTRDAMREDPASLLWKIAKTPEEADGRTAFSAAKLKDAAACRVVADYIAALGEGVANLVNLLRPQAVLLGGGISGEGDGLIDPLKEYVFPRLYVPVEYAPLTIACATLGNDAGIYGAAHYALERSE